MYQRKLGGFEWTFDASRAEDLSDEEQLALHSALVSLIGGKEMTFDPLVDGVFRRWLGKGQAVDIDMSVEIDGELRRSVLTIRRSPTLFDQKRLAYRLALPRSANA